MEFGNHEHEQNVRQKESRDPMVSTLPTFQGPDYCIDLLPSGNRCGSSALGALIVCPQDVARRRCRRQAASKIMQIVEAGISNTLVFNGTATVSCFSTVRSRLAGALGTGQRQNA